MTPRVGPSNFFDIIPLMIKAILFDFSRVLLFPKDTSYTDSLNQKHRELSNDADYKLLNHFTLNDELLRLLNSLKNNYVLCLFTSGTIQDSPELFTTVDNIFQKVYSGIKLGLNKKDNNSYTMIAADLTLSPEELLLIDDSLDNIAAAKLAGLITIHYKNNEQLSQEFKTLLE